MHILATTSASLDDLIEPVDLQQSPADMVALSFTDSDLAGIASAWQAQREALPSLRLAALRDLRHPMSVDLWIDNTAAHARVILVRVLGGYEWWRYGCDRLSALARQKGIALALLPGECHQDDARLAERSTVSPKARAALLACFREGGPDNMRALTMQLACLAGRDIEAPEAEPVAKAGFYAPGHGIVEASFFPASANADRPVVPILFYRSMLLASDVAPIDALVEALEEQGLCAVPVFVSSLRDPVAADLVRNAVEALEPQALITATAFSSGAEPGEKTLFDRFGVPVFQVVTATTRREAWQEGQRGLAPADLAMHVVLPELDGRLMAGAISFKDEAALDEGLSFGVQRNRPEPARIRQVAARIAAFLKLGGTPVAERRIVVLIPDYPSAPGRTGYAVGLDVPSSVLAMLHDLYEAGYAVSGVPETPRALMQQLEEPSEALSLDEYRCAFDALPEEARETLLATWGPAEDDAEDGVFPFRAARFGNVTVALAPDRGRSADRRVDYHDPTLAPRHALVAFGHWMREGLDAHALIHVGAHGTLEWLPGKTVALTETCFPEIVAGALPVVYPFIVSNPGEAAQAKRRIGAVTLGHLTPPLAGAGLSPDQQELERLVDEYAQADGLDRRRRDRLAQLIVETAERTGLTRDAGVEDTGDTDAALMQIDAWLCDLKDFAIKDGLHIYGRGSGMDEGPERSACAESEKRALLAALDARHIAPGPSGAPARGRADVLPTGRNIFTADPRTLPTPTATALGRMAADEAVRGYLQEHGDWPRSLVIDLWGSASLRTGGEEIAQGLALMGCRPQWDQATGRVTGIEVLPPASLGRPRIDVTWRISGLFRDMFPTQIALLDTAVAAVAARDEDESENPLAAAARLAGKAPARIFGSAPGTYGAGPEEKLARGDWQERAELGQAYLDAGAFAFGGAEGEGRREDGAFARQVADADMLIHTGDDAGRDILEGSADVAFIGGFAAAVEALGGKADLVVLDTTDPERPRARSLAQAIARTVRARAVNPRFIEGQLRHGPRGAAELTETVDRLIGFAETTDAVSGSLIDAVFDAYLGDERVRDFLLAENPAAARAMAERFCAARRRGLWHPRRNSVDDDLAALLAEATA
ncbi:cobaltochelatase subunit CobN [Nitratireductor aquimarinus]|uniref:cobaltochelatase subunit CobN n=1 Tax=Nitratireductor TaxID=245876 RepID=UPI0019D3672E|nr:MULTISPECIES: cobaltochelatase subunit CobN [Nitratireductor]MBN7778389.1 cobaltochelatase subunit CobN [Nitratireductor pacificus]MBN7782711.1 cobaltochelatase subunit CobN [Nitratireductor pacificus]MBN7791518.1 cobaltochelatase subunit CobN [Nitratireductor aquimarinus]MBY6100776.1 cobaltochelatase subunit CobN [Nitratireductor aquimarinus]